MKKSKNLIPHTEIVHPLITTIPVVQVHPLYWEGFFKKKKNSDCLSEFFIKKSDFFVFFLYKREVEIYHKNFIF